MTGSISARVDAIFCDCLFREDEILDGKPPEGAIIIDGIASKFGMHPGRVEEHKEEIRELLNLMPDSFHTGEGKGGGMSFLNLCMTKDEEQWGEHRNMEQLVVLAIAALLGKYCIPREMWSMFPGGMPYVAFDTRESVSQE